jgi:hypothetical protein
MPDYEKLFSLLVKQADTGTSNLIDVRRVHFEERLEPKSPRQEGTASRARAVTRRAVDSRLAGLAAKESEIAMRVPVVSGPPVATDESATETDASRVSQENTLVLQDEKGKGRISMPLAPTTPADTVPSEPVLLTNSPNNNQLETPQRRSSSETVIRTAILGEYIYASIALVLGLASIVAGSLLCVYGVAGHTSFTASLLGLNTNLNDAAPGVVLFVVGLFMIWATRPKVKLSDLVG